MLICNDSQNESNHFKTFQHVFFFFSTTLYRQGRFVNGLNPPVFELLHGLEELECSIIIDLNVMSPEGPNDFYPKASID